MSIQNDNKNDDGAAVVEGIRAAWPKMAEDLGKGIDAIHGPLWSSRNELAKTLLTLASGSLVLTVTFGEQVVTLGPQECWLLVFSWICLSGSMLFAVLSLWKAIGLRSVPAMIIDNSSAAEKSVEVAMKNGENPLAVLGPILLNATTQAFAHENWARRFLSFSLASFVFGILFLTAGAAVSYVGSDATEPNAIVDLSEEPDAKSRQRVRHVSHKEKRSYPLLPTEAKDEASQFRERNNRRSLDDSKSSGGATSSFVDRCF